MSSVPFIFIHIGETHYPTYVSVSLAQCHRWNPTNPIYFISNKIHASHIDLPYVQHIFLEDIKQTDKHQIFNHISGLDRGFRDGFWKYTTERLFVFEDFCIQYDIGEAYHIENDNMVYFNSVELIDQFRKVNGLSSPALSQSENTFGILYMNNITILGELTGFLLYNRENANEMILGSKFFNAHNTKTSFLPSIPPIDKNLTDDEKRYISANIDGFKGVFDPAQYGQWLGGIDPRNGDAEKSKPLVFSNTCARIEANKFTYVAVSETCGLNRIHIQESTLNIDYPIYVIHVHSKNCSGFLI